jgi:hypothetical protein
MTISVPRDSARPSRRGLAVPAALLALVVVSLFIAGSAFLAMQEARAAHGSLGIRAALEAAEFGAAAVLRDWDRRWNLTLPTGAPLGPWSHTLGSGDVATVRGTRASPTTFWIISEAAAGRTAGTRAARRVVNLVYRLDIPGVDVLAAITAADSVSVTGTGHVSGMDTVTAASVIPQCAVGLPAVAGVAAADTTRVCEGAACVPVGRITGVPRLAADSSADDSLRTATVPGSAWANLAARADVILPPGAVITPAPVVAAGVCQVSQSSNWGDPAAASPCADHHPVIWARGDVTVIGGIGQGILLAEGDVRFGAGASFAGLIVTADDFVIGVGGGTMIGAVLAGDRRRGGGDHTRVNDGGLVRFSSCAVQRALYATAPLRRVRDRAWAELF